MISMPMGQIVTITGPFFRLGIPFTNPPISSTSGDVYIFNYPNNTTNSYFKVNYNSLPTQRVYWDSPDEFYVVMWQDTVWTPVVNYSTYSDDDGIGHQMVYVNPTLIGDTLNIIGTIYEEGISQEILVKIQ